MYVYESHLGGIYLSDELIEDLKRLSGSRHTRNGTSLWKSGLTDGEGDRMSDLISRQAAIEALKRAEALTRAFGYHHVIDTIRDLPTAKPSTTLMKVEAGVDKESLRKAMEEAELTLLPAEKKGKWIDYCGGVKCDQCGFECDDTYYLGEANYCPNCGAKMED